MDKDQLKKALYKDAGITEQELQWAMDMLNIQRSRYPQYRDDDLLMVMYIEESRRA